MKKILVLLMVATVAAACDRSKAELEQRVLELQTVSATAVGADFRIDRRERAADAAQLSIELSPAATE